MFDLTYLKVDGKYNKAEAPIPDGVCSFERCLLKAFCNRVSGSHVWLTAFRSPGTDLEYADGACGLPGTVLTLLGKLSTEQIVPTVKPE